MNKLIAIDLDGTLLNDEKTIPEKNIITLRQLIDKGHEVVIATGRRYWEAKILVKEIDRPLVILANNGNVARDTNEDKLIIKKYLDMDDFRIVIQESKRRELHPLLLIDDYENGVDVIVEKGRTSDFYDVYISRSKDRYREVEDYLNMEDTNILSVAYAGDKKDMLGLYNFVNEQYPDSYRSHIIENIKVAESILEIMNPLGDKWLSILEYSKEKNIDKSNIIAIGDDNNDIGMVKNAGLGIAMKNSSQFVRDIADIITEKDNNQAGVAFELKKILKL